jgi:hypothetical protein
VGLAVLGRNRLGDLVGVLSSSALNANMCLARRSGGRSAQAGSASLAAGDRGVEFAVVDRGTSADCSPVAGLKTGAVRGLVEACACRR